MDFDTFDDLLVELCEAAEIEDVEDILDSGLLMVSGRVVKLDYLPHLDECRMLIELGPLDAGPADLPRRLLRHNLDAILDETPLMALDEDAAAVVASARLPMQGIHTGEALLDALAWQVGKAADAWKTLLAPPPSFTDDAPSGFVFPSHIDSLAMKGGGE